MKNSSSLEQLRNKWNTVSCTPHKGHSSLTCGSMCALCLFVAIIQCTTLHWRSPELFSMGSLYRVLQQPLGETPEPKTSSHLDSLRFTSMWKCTALTHSTYRSFFPVSPKLWSCVCVFVCVCSLLWSCVCVFVCVCSLVCVCSHVWERETRSHHTTAACVRTHTSFITVSVTWLCSPLGLNWW